MPPMASSEVTSSLVLSEWRAETDVVVLAPAGFRCLSSPSSESSEVLLDELTLGGDDVPLATEVVEVLARSVAGCGVDNPGVERPLVVRDLDGPVGSLCRTE